MLAIEVSHLTGRYVATSYNNRDRPEWPPHPARLFSALVATHFEVIDEIPDPEERAALEWLAALEPPPEVTASDASVREIVTVFVPVNDTSVLSLPDPRAVEEAQQVLAEAQARSGDPALGVADRKKAAKAAQVAQRQVVKLQERLAAATARALAVPENLTGLAVSQARKVLPESRTRQARTFPSVTPVDPKVVFQWPEAAPTAEHRRCIDRLLSRVVRLGHSSSLVSCRLVEEPPPARWLPADGGECLLRVAQSGQLAALESHHARHQGNEPRVMPSRFQRYAESVAFTPVTPPASVFSSDWIVLRRVGGPALPIAATAGVARALRRALMAHAGVGGAPVPEALSGHRADGAPSEQDHLAIVPLPFVGHERATGTLLGVALVQPRTLDDATRLAALAPLARWEARVRQADEDTPRLHLALGAAGEWELERLEDEAAQRTLRPEAWCGPARHWLSVTPVALDHNPGDLASRDPGKLAAAIEEARETIARACQRIGLPAPERVEILPAAPVAGAAKARQFPPYPEEKSKGRRVLTHVRVSFAEPVSGPVLLGAGRYLGLGLLRPEGDHD